MFKVSKMCVISQKSWMVLLMLSCSLMLTSVFSIQIASALIRGIIIHSAYQKYGMHSGVLLGIDEQNNFFDNHQILGRFSIHSPLKLDNGKVATVGWMSQDAIEHGHINLIKGDFPNQKNELAIEEAYLSLIDTTWNIGEYRILTLNEVERKYILSGIIENYSYNWSVPFDLIEGVNDFPNIFVSYNHSDLIWPENLFIRIEGRPNEINVGFFDLSQEHEKIDIIVNERLLFRGMQDYQNVFILGLTYSLIILLFSYISITQILHSHKSFNKNEYAILKSLGTCSKKLKLFFYNKMLIVFCVSLLVSIPFVFVVCKIIINTSFYNISFVVNNGREIIINVIISLFLTLTILFIIIKKNIENISEFSVQELIKNEENKFIVFNKIVKSNSIKSSLFFKQVMLYPMQSFISTLLIAVSIVIITLSLLLSYAGRGFWEYTDGFYLNSQETFVSVPHNGMHGIINNRQVFTQETVAQLSSFDAVKYVDASPFVPNFKMELKFDSMACSLHKIWSNYTRFYNEYDYLYIIRPYFRIVVLNQYDYIQRYGDSACGLVNLYFPYVIYNSRIMEYIENKVNVIKVKHCSYEFELHTINLIVNEINMLDKVNRHSLSYEVMFTISEKHASKENIHLGFNPLRIYLNENTTDEAINELEGFIYNLMATIPGNLMQNIGMALAIDKQIYNFLSVLSVVTFMVISSLAIIGAWCIVYQKFKLRVKIWGILMTHGMGYADVLSIVKNEMYGIYIIALSISFPLLMVIYHVTKFDNFFLLYILCYLLSITVIFIFLRLGLFYFKSLLMKKSISSLLKSEIY